MTKLAFGVEPARRLFRLRLARYPALAAALAAFAGEEGNANRPRGMLIVGVPIFPPGLAALRRAWTRLARRPDPSRSHVQTFTARSAARWIRGGGPFTITGRLGFRLFSGRLLEPLEDFSWWYRLQGALGRRFPSWCSEIQIVARKSAEPPPGARVNFIS